QFDYQSVMAGTQEDFVNFQVLTNQIYNELVKAPLDSLGNLNIDKLYFIPDKSLYGLPLDILATEVNESARPNYKNIKYLINDYDISYDYSISSIFNERIIDDGNKGAQGKILAIAPFYDENSEGRGFKELKNNVSEVENVSEYFDTKILKGKNATEENFIDEFVNYDILHFAMHAHIDDVNSDYSHLVFSAGQGQNQDDLMHGFEIYNLSFDVNMAVLSACNTSKGKYEAGEGVINLSRAFSYAGAKSIITSSWEADDYVTSQIMGEFYKNLSDGLNKSQALRQAKMTYLNQASSDKLHPFYWGTFSLVGKDDVLNTGNSESSYLLWIMSLLVVGLILFFVVRKRSFA
ncbi:MAG: CHAT domain-containing protein, partial [Bacteroidota bacterium]